eukprot:1141723-Amorphochlora_amoeboformis.AAC.2
MGYVATRPATRYEHTTLNPKHHPRAQNYTSHAIATCGHSSIQHSFGSSLRYPTFARNDLTIICLSLLLCGSSRCSFGSFYQGDMTRLVLLGVLGLRRLNNFFFVDTKEYALGCDGGYVSVVSGSTPSR